MKKEMKVTAAIFIKAGKYRWSAAVMAFALILSACAGGAAAEQAEADIDFISTQVAATMMVSRTQAVEAALPASTVVIKSTAKPKLQILDLQGKGDSVVILEHYSGQPALLDISHTGSSNFVVYGYNADREKTELIVNTIGNYSGRRLINIYKSDSIAMLEIAADGEWEVKVKPFDIDYMNQSQYLGGTYRGSGDDVVFIMGGSSGMITVKCSHDSNIAIWAHGDSGVDLLINDIGPYEGTKILPKDTWMLVINSLYPWEMSIEQ